MEFNGETLRPTYLGYPGSQGSNAFNISERLGLSQTIVTAAARNLVAKDSQDLNNMIADLVAKRRQAEEEAISLQYKPMKLKINHELATAYERFVNKREQMQDQAKQKG